MSALRLWFLDVGHGDCTYIELPNGGRMMIDCGCGSDHWPSRLLSYYRITREDNPASIPNLPSPKYALDNLVISHPHGDHIADIEAIHDDIGFFLLTGGYRDFIDRISIEAIDFKKRGQNAAKKFINVVKNYTGRYDETKDRTRTCSPICTVRKKRFINYEDGIDLNDLSWMVSLEIANHKVLFSGDMTAKGITRILSSNKAKEFKEFIKGTTIFKAPHHGRENGCSQEMFDGFENKPLLCIVSDEVLNQRNEGTSNISWYTERTSDQLINIDGENQDRKVLTTRKDKDIYLQIDQSGNLAVSTNVFRDVKPKILQ